MKMKIAVIDGALRVKSRMAIRLSHNHHTHDDRKISQEKSF
jgi:hypothetical protein